MGMSASQARLLSITARLTNNEFRAQTITNSKLRLATESEVASAKYMDALNSKQLMFMSYDDNGDANKIPLTANTLLMYGDLKNQYALVNNSGKILLNTLDIKNYESSVTMADFMYKYGIGKVDNPEYIDSIKDLFGSKYNEILELKEDPYSWVMSDINNFLPYVYNLEEFGNLDILNISESDYNALRNVYFTNLDNVGINSTLDDKLDGNNIFTNMIINLLNCPEYVEEPDLFVYAKDLLSPRCWESTGINDLIDGQQNTLNDEQIWHIEHVLAQYLWSGNTGTMTVNINGTNETITNGSSTIWGMTNGGGDGSDPCKVRDVLAKPENQDLKTRLQQFYYEVCLHIETNDTLNGFNSGDSISNNGGNTVKPNTYFGQEYYNLIKELLEAVAEDILETKDERYTNSTNLQKYDEDFNVLLLAFSQDLGIWVNNVKNLINEFIEKLNNLPAKLIPDEKDSKYQWYKNLWYRMGSTDEKTKGNTYIAIDDNLLNNEEWLQFAFEHGILTLERAEFVEQGSDVYTKMGTYDWVAMPYQNAGDFVEVDDEKAIAIAEVKYKKTITEIESKDNKYDQDLKKLDTEHTALQTEYDSIKEVISKNVERSFKAFS